MGVFVEFFYNTPVAIIKYMRYILKYNIVVCYKITMHSTDKRMNIVDALFAWLCLKINNSCTYVDNICVVYV